MTFPFERIFRLLVSQKTPAEDVREPAPVVAPTASPLTANLVEATVPTAETLEQRPFHVFEAPLSGDGALIFVLPPNQPEGDDDKRSRRHLRRQRAKAREVSRREARRAKQSWQSAAAQ